jgi:hypothetical protein
MITVENGSEMRGMLSSNVDSMSKSVPMVCEKRKIFAIE